MPKVYDQQVSWQPAGTQKMQYDRLQDFITPAMEDAARSADNIQQAIVEMQDRQVADAAEALAQNQADIIKNFDEFSLENPQGEMVNRSMKEWDKFIAEMPVEARRRFERNNPKAREIFQLKSEEAATKRARQYTTAAKKADVNRLAQDVIARGGDAEGIQGLLQQEYDKAGKTMTPDDLLEYQQLLGHTTQQGAIDDAISHGNLWRAQKLNENREFTTNLSPAEIARNRETILKLWEKKLKEDEDGSGNGKTTAKGGSLYNSMVMTQQQDNGYADTAGIAQRAISVYNMISGGASMNSVILQTAVKDDKGNVIPVISPDTIIAGGKTLEQVYKMYPEQRQKLMKSAKEAATVDNSPAMTVARQETQRLAALAWDAEHADSDEKKIEAEEQRDSLVLKMASDGTLDVIKFAYPEGFTKEAEAAYNAALARNDQETQTMTSASQVYGTGRANVGDRTYNASDVLQVMPLPHTPANEAEALIENARWTGKMSKADLLIPQKVSSDVASMRLSGSESDLVRVGLAEKQGKVPRGFSKQYMEDLQSLKDGVVPMCLSKRDVTYKEYNDCLEKKGWQGSPYSVGTDYDSEKQKVTMLAASGRILARSNGKSKEADYNEGTYAWALDVADGIILNEVLKNPVYRQESGLDGVGIQLLNSTARTYRQNLRDSGKFSEYIDTSHFPDNGFDSFNPNKKKECAANIKQSALYDFVNQRIVSLGGKADSPQAEAIAEYMRGAIRGKDIKMKVDLNKDTEYKTVDPSRRGIGKVANKNIVDITKPIFKANEEE